MKGYMYILECVDGSYYVGSTKYLERRFLQHQNGEGANYTRKRRPIKLIYFEVFNRIDHAFYREKQVQGWSRKKKQALINGNKKELKSLAECRNETHWSVRFDFAHRPTDFAHRPDPTRPDPKRPDETRPETKRNETKRNETN